MIRLLVEKFSVGFVEGLVEAVWLVISKNKLSSMLSLVLFPLTNLAIRSLS